MPQLSVTITTEAQDALREFCAQQGITATALVEFVLLALNHYNEGLELSPLLGEAVEAGRRLDAERRITPVRTDGG